MLMDTKNIIVKKLRSAINDSQHNVFALPKADHGESLSVGLQAFYAEQEEHQKTIQKELIEFADSVIKL